MDLNFIVDYDPKKFIDSIDMIINPVLNASSDLLCLLISALQDYDTTTTKYIIPGIGGDRTYPNDFLSKGKVNCICSVMKDALMISLQRNNDIGALNPVLCTLACQRPALLVEALKVIRLICKNNLQSAKCTSGLKYLAYLAENTHIFNAALGCCDFDMARCIGKMSQMDPKVHELKTSLSSSFAFSSLI